MNYNSLVRTTLLTGAVLLGAANCKCNKNTLVPPAQTAGSASAQSLGLPPGGQPSGQIPAIGDIFEIGVPLPALSAAAAPSLSGGGACGQVQEDFSNPQAKRRYFYNFGQFQIAVLDKNLKIRGKASDWSGAGVDTKNGANGEPFDATGCRYLEYDISGKLSGRMKVELVDFSGKAHEVWFESVPSGNHAKVRLEGVSGKISKLQWVAQPGTEVDLKITNIKFSAEGSPAPAAAPGASDADPIITIAPVNGSRSSGRYLQAMNELADYFLKNDGNKPNATQSAVVGGIRARAAFHVFEDQATHLCNGGATTSESQALFFNFMTLYGAATGKRQGAQEAYAYIRYFMMPHDGAESPQLPDSKLGVGGSNPFLMHWLVDVSGEAKARTCTDGRPGSGVFGRNIVYNMYDPTPRSAPYPSVALDPSGRVDLTLRQKGGGNHAASFSSAPDADQWLANGAYWAGRYGLGNPGNFLLNLRRGLSEGMTPDDAKYYPDTMRFAVYWGTDKPPAQAYKGTIYEMYTGYQDPAAWEIMGRPKWAKSVVKFLGDAQSEFAKRYGQTGPFMPVFKDGAFGWEGSDPNTFWMGFQYRTFAHLAHYYLLTGDGDAKKILVNFADWLKANQKSEGAKMSIPLALTNKVVLGRVFLSGYDPGAFGLAAQGLIALAARDNNSEFKKMAEALLDDLANNRKGKNGAYYYTDPIPVNSATYGFQNAEVGIAYGLYTLLLNN